MGGCKFLLDAENDNIKKCQICARVVISQTPIDKLYAVCKGLPSQGLGDTTAKIIDTLSFGYGLQIAHETAQRMGLPDCGCDQRAQFLNNLFPYSSGTPDGV